MFVDFNLFEVRVCHPVTLKVRSIRNRINLTGCESKPSQMPTFGSNTRFGIKVRLLPQETRHAVFELNVLEFVGETKSGCVPKGSYSTRGFATYRIDFQVMKAMLITGLFIVHEESEYSSG